DGLGPGLLRHAQPVWESVNGDHPFRSQQEGAADGKLADWPAAPDGDGVAGLNVTIHGAKVAGRKDVREEHYFVVGYSFRNLQRTNIGEGQTGIMRLASAIAANHA